MAQRQVHLRSVIVQHVMLVHTVHPLLQRLQLHVYCAPQEHSVLQQEHHLLQLVSPVHLDTIALVLMVLHIHVQKAVGMAIQVPQQ